MPRTIIEKQARRMGAIAAEDFEVERDYRPCEDKIDGVSTMDGWDDARWEQDWGILLSEGAYEESHDACRRAWDEGFYS